MISSQDLKKCKRILVIGGCGSGKSTFAKFLGKKLNLNIIHLDQHFHNPNWISKSEVKFTDIVNKSKINDFQKSQGF